MFVSYDSPHSGLYIPQGVQNVFPMMQSYVDDAAAAILGMSAAVRAAGMDTALTAAVNGVQVFEGSYD